MNKTKIEIKKSLPENSSVSRYREFLEVLKIEFGMFLNMAESASKNDKYKIHLKSRKKSIELRKILKDFRDYSIEHEKYLKKRKKEFLDELSKEIKLEDLE